MTQIKLATEHRIVYWIRVQFEGTKLQPDTDVLTCREVHHQIVIKTGTAISPHQESGQRATIELTNKARQIPTGRFLLM